MEISQYRHILGIANISFDMFSFELFCSTLLGNTLVLANEEEQKNLVAMSKLIQKQHVDFFVTTPSRVELLLIDECAPCLKEVKAILLGGEKVTGGLYHKLKLATDAKIYNSYGPTEATSACTNKLVVSDDITVGKPLSNMQVYICDANLNLVPIGVAGEICVGGKRSCKRIF
ncbi:MAG: AMP-binding protein [Clostridia bacterium]|nr:AMP-binding protein [Clostridia bacterium]